MAEIAVRQHGVVSLKQLEAIGVSRYAASKRAAAGHLHRIHQAVYSLVPRTLLKREGLWLAAVLACGPEAVLSHRSAAALHELRDYGHTRVEVTVPGRSRGGHDGVLIHRSLTLSASDRTTVSGIPCTTVARTLLDLGDVVNRRAVERACDQAEIIQVFDLRAITDQLERNPNRRGALTLKTVLDEHYIGTTATVNGFEDMFLGLVRDAGLPDPEVNVMLDLGDGESLIKVDFLWRAQRVAVETDGHRFHSTQQAFERDRRRDQRLTVARWRPVRVTRRQCVRQARLVQKTLKVLVQG